MTSHKSNLVQDTLLPLQGRNLKTQSVSYLHLPTLEALVFTKGYPMFSL